MAAREGHAVPGARAAGLFWSRLGLREAYESLILRSNLPLTAQALAGEPSADSIVAAIQWVRRAPRALGLDVIEEEDLSLELLLDRFMEIRGPALVLLELRGEIIALTAVFESARWVRVLKPDGTEERLGRLALYNLTARLVASESASVSSIFEGVAGGKALLDRMQLADALGDRRHTLLVRFQLDGAHPFLEQLKATGAWRALGLHLAISAVQALAALGAYWTLGNAMIDGQIDAGRVVGWSILALSDAPLQYLASRALSHFTIALAGNVKRRLLEGALSVSERAVRASGFGELLARTNETSVVEQLSLSEMSGAALASFEVLGAAWFLAHGSMQLAALGALVLMLGLAALVANQLVSAYRAVFARRVMLTDDLVEKIIGHRTRAVQQSPAQRHGGEDFSLAEYAKVSSRLDRALSLSATLPRVWLVVGACVLLLAFVSRAEVAKLVPTSIGILLAYRALVALFPAVQRFVECHTAWRGVKMLLDAGAQREKPSRPLDVDHGHLETTLSMAAVSFAYRPGGRPVLNHADLRIRRGDKVLLEGPSGSGKSTILKLIAGEQQPSGGVILVSGTDRFSVSDVDWRRRVASAPQFHENHVFSNTFAFNLDPRGEPGYESRDARTICAELGLMPLLERMPQGFAQMVGETGWQLSHGERSRIFIARALLQNSDLFLFDESFGALDPETLLIALECVRRRARTLLVVAHT